MSRLERMIMSEDYVEDKEIYLASCRVFDKMYKDRSERLYEARRHKEMPNKYFSVIVKGYFEDCCPDGLDEHGHNLKQAVGQSRRNFVYGFASDKFDLVDLPTAKDVKRVMKKLEDELAVVYYLKYLTVGVADICEGDGTRPSIDKILGILKREVDLPYLLSTYDFDKESYDKDLAVVASFFEKTLTEYGIEILPEVIEAQEHGYLDSIEKFDIAAEKLGIFRIKD